jgi:hypothetical protein
MGGRTTFYPASRSGKRFQADGGRWNVPLKKCLKASNINKTAFYSVNSGNLSLTLFTFDNVNV